MTKGIVIFIMVIMLMILLAVIFFPKQETPTYQHPEMTEITPPPATGDVDDLVDATFSEISDEDLLIQEEEDDLLLITLDKQEISDFGQTINESEL